LTRRANHTAHSSARITRVPDVDIRAVPGIPSGNEGCTLAAISRLGRQITEVTEALQRVGARYALIGGLALASYNVIRATQDVDLLTDIEKAEEIDAELVKLGYRCVHRSVDAGNYMRGDERVDLLYAHRPIARGLLERATQLNSSLGSLRVISTEGLIGFKLQGLVNDPRRTQDLEDIRALLRANRAKLDMAEVREYFSLFGRDSLLDELLEDTD
jgi:predicted nucleotidyltransferase